MAVFGLFPSQNRYQLGKGGTMTQYRLMRADHETSKTRLAGACDIRYTLILILTLVCISCLYWIRFTDREICLVGVGNAVNRSLPESPPRISLLEGITSVPLSRSTTKREVKAQDELNLTEIQEKFILYTAKCHIPNYDFKEPNVLKKYYSKPPRKCSKDVEPFIFYPKLNQTGGFSCIGVDDTQYKKFYSDRFELDNCTYMETQRDLSHIKIDYYHKFGDPKPLRVDDCPPEEYLWIQCGVSNKSYEQPLFMPKVKPVDRTIRENNLGQKPLHVLILGLDSVSRLNAHRQLPKTIAYLKGKKNLVELFGYNKIGVNSSPNQIPLITGIPFKNPYPIGLNLRASNAHFDNLTRFLWDDLGSRGYRTMFYEEQWIYGLFLYPPLSGFLREPTTYWPRPLMQAIDKSSLKQGNCVGPDVAAKLYLDYTHQLFKISGSERPLFTYGWLSEVAHDNINGGQLVDEYLLDFFTKMTDDGILDNTAVFFISDHGMRFDSFRYTPQGRLEDMLPFAFILMPDRFHTAYPNAKKIMDINSRRLLTAIDMHASLLELADVWDEDRLIRTANGFSIFSTIIPNERTCKEAGIDIEFCACYNYHAMNASTRPAQSMGELLVEKINLRLRETEATNCSDFRLDKIVDFIRLSEGADWTDFFKISVEMEPYARFEVTGELMDPSEFEWRILSDFDRVDRYSDHSECARGQPYEKLCHCKL
ncbi:uncharacterized protein LOC100907525 [Galendromus occidentalis]|uniref:Uncharacterized protein LOC100907525 n=1 Tax=Galendromus occidentalis TaxID=34638 RepID=A0AAJ6VYL0_9ACAR|nr:uncharacterized protein LOC100907525 [Galendromus occidentalis]